jgi:ELWxxDGT repeat protein
VSALADANHRLAALDGSVFFAADDGSSGIELWRSDGTEEGTGLVADVAGDAEGSAPAGLTAAENRLFFRACEAASGCEPWTSDGSAAGTRLLADLRPGAGSSNPQRFHHVGSTLYFSADDGSTGVELWALPLAGCAGDCDADGAVSAADLVKAVNLLLGRLPLRACPAFSTAFATEIGVADVVSAVSAALNGCGPAGP